MSVLTPENVECPGCDGSGQGPIDHTCGVCDGTGRTPQNVDLLHPCHDTPENVETSKCSTCEGAGWDWKRVADDGLLPDDPVGEYPCPDCTPDNVEEPT